MNIQTPLFKIPFKNIDEVKIVAINKEGFIGSKNHLALSMSFIENGTSSSNYNTSPISINYNQNNNKQTILFDIQENQINALLEQIKILKQAEYDEKLKLTLVAALKGIILCTHCYKNNSTFLFSFESLCRSCFKEKYGNMIMQSGNGEYYGGHKSYLAGGKFGDHEIGSMYLTDKYFIFKKNNKNLKIM